MKRFRSSTALAGSIVILGGGLLVSGILMWTSPVTLPVEKTRSTRIVQTISLEARTERIAVTAQGPVIPARRVIMRPEVSGRILDHHASLVPGGYVEAGETLIQIDPADYELALAERLGALEEVQFELAIEKGRQTVASREWKLLENELTLGDVNRSLVLREPHLARIDALLHRATNAIAKAKLDLTRTAVTAPFNAIVLSESVEVGQLVAPGTEICVLAGTDAFWVQATVPLSDLRRLRLPGPEEEGSDATVFLDTGSVRPASWPGKVVKLLSDLEPTGLMARVLVRVSDPLGLKTGSRDLPLLLGSYVRVQIDAGTIENVIAIPRAAVREGDSIWVVDDKQELHIRAIDVLWSRQETVLAANCLNPGDQLVVSGLRVALPGMKVDPQRARLDGAPPISP